MQLYRQLHRKLTYLKRDEKKVLCAAYWFAKKAHAAQLRDSGEPYIIHPVAVAEILASHFMDYQTVMAGLLHDVIEDTIVTKEELAQRFGGVVAQLVDGVTKLSLIETAGNRDEKQARSFQKMILAMSHDIRVIIIKMADRLHNMQTVNAVLPAKRRRIARETLDIYAPIAHRLGMYELYAKLEDFAFAALYPRRYQILQKAVNKVYGGYEDVIKALSKHLIDILEEHHVEGVKISSRTKHLYSIYRKMMARKTSFANIVDIYGIRIIVQNDEDCYRALWVVHSLYRPMHERIKDYIAAPKLNGYQSLHTVVFGPYGTPVEFQIRSQKMDKLDNTGIVAHWAYKSGDAAVTHAQSMAESWITELLEMQRATNNSLEFLEGVKMELYPDKVFVFTPKGVILELPRGATVVDFAYAVHSEIGHTCVAARIDREYWPLSTVLRNGQTIKIVTAQSAEPNPQWLNFVVTAKAKHCIRNYLRDKKAGGLIDLGKQLLKTACYDLAADFDAFSERELLQFAQSLNCFSMDTVYIEIGMGNRSAHLIAYQLINHGKAIGAVAESLHNTLVIKGTESSAIHFASCCYPLPGEEIEGYLNAEHGLDIHTKDCACLTHLSQTPEKHVTVTWSDNIRGEFRVALDIEVVNQIGTAAELTQAISKAHGNIASIHSDDSDGEYAILRVTLLVKNLTHLQRIRRYISKVPSVIGVTRRKQLA